MSAADAAIAPPPKADPERLALRAQPRPVARLNRRTLATLGGVSALAVLGAAVWALQGPSFRSGAPNQELYNVDRVPRAEGLEGLPRDYGNLPPVAPAVPQLGPPLPGDLGRPILEAQRDGRLEPSPEGYAPAIDPEEAARRAERERLRREAEAADKAEVFFGTGRGAGPAQANAAGLADAPAEPTRRDLAAVGQGGGARADEFAAQNNQGAKQTFVDRETDRRIYGTGTLTTPRSPYQVMAGTIIPAAMVTGINSDLPGQIIATVTENVYDSATGRHLLIPQGARLLGQYDSGVGFGQQRVLLVWNRLIMPDGSSITLDRLPGVDVAGKAGLEDEVDNHWLGLIGGAALSTLLGVGAELAAPQNQGGGDDRVIVATRDGAQGAVNEVGQQITRRNLNVQPTLTVRPGFPVRVIVSRDLVLRPYGAASAGRSGG